MGRISRTVLCITIMIVLAGAVVFAQHRGGGVGQDYSPGPTYGGFGGWYGFPAFGSNGPYYGSIGGPATAVLPNYWWVSPYPSENPCQAGCNLNAGYEWDSVGTLILATNPPKARVTLDGVYAGTTDKLGPFQLPVGEHTLHIEARGFESSDIIVKFDKPGVQNLNVELKRLVASAKPAPRS